MTAEVAIMNVVGVAMAADSAVTIGTDARKIFTSTDKLFQLTKFHPVGVMTYGNAVLMGTPWETIIKEYRSHIGNRSFPTIDRYAEDFLRFLTRHSVMFPRQVQDDYVARLLRRHLNDFRERVLKRAIDAEISKKNTVKNADIRRISAAEVDQFKDHIASLPRLVGFNRQFRSQIERRYRATAGSVIAEQFGSIPMTPSTKSALQELSLNLLTRRAFRPMTSGLVFAGFGDSEFLPSLVAYEVEGFVHGKLRSAQASHTKIEPLGTEASIIPFAQQEVVQTFMEGVDSKLKQQFRELTEKAWSQVATAVVDAITPKNAKIAKDLDSVFQTGLPRVLQELGKEWDSLSSQYWSPITEIVSTLPKDELGAMAEALVNLTKFKRRITPQKETVGGPIDVAVITKGDGFVWIKRKHYFDPMLNPRVMNRLAAGEHR